MHLGDWVNFATIVVKEPTALGSRPSLCPLPRTRRGMIVGERQVYDVEAGAPPTLSNPQTVLLVAVSLRRTYRVFPGDCQPATPPTPRRPRRAAPTPPATGATINLSPLDVQVADAVTQQIASGALFTAYDITLHLRAVNPGAQIDHDAVRPLVHGHMDPVVTSGLYVREAATYGAQTATRYVPA